MNEIALNYGKALFSLANDNSLVEEWQQQCKTLKRILKENPDFIVVLNSPFLTIEERLSMVDKTLNQFDEMIVNLIKLLVENNRFTLINDVLQSFNSCCNEYRGIDEGIVYSSIPLDEDTLKKLEEKISYKENTKIELFNHIDPSLIGGVKVVINNHIYDGSIKNHLEQMKKNLLKKEGNL